MVYVFFQAYRTSPKFLPLLEAPLDVAFVIASRAVEVCSWISGAYFKQYCSCFSFSDTRRKYKEPKQASTEYGWLTMSMFVVAINCSVHRQSLCEPTSVM